MFRATRWLAVMGTLLVVSPLALQAAEGDEMTTNPMYTYWAHFKPGSTVTQSEKTVYGESDKGVVPDGVDEKIVTYKILSSTPEHVVVEVVVTEREFLGFVESAPTKKTFPMKIKKAYVQAVLDLVGATDGTDNLEIAGKKIACKTMAGTSKKDGEMVENKIWMSEAVPGGIVKRVRTTKQDGKLVAETTILVKSFKVAD